MYKGLIRPLLFQFDPESIHDMVLKAAGPLGRCPVSARCLRYFFSCTDPRLRVRLCGIDFPNPFGLAAGFDKECEAVDFFSALGFGSIEIGTITAEPQPGNPRPRIFRLVADQALINRMGFPSDGVDAVAKRLAVLRRRAPGIIVGVNIGKSKAAALDRALQDYLSAFSKVMELGDYFVLNVSSPNTPELRKLQEPARLEDLFKGVAAINRVGKPLFVKIAPDLSWQEVNDILECSLNNGISGIIATNTTIAREGLSTPANETGGLSGAPLRPKALGMVRYLYAQSGGKIPIIGVGGVSCSADAVAMLGAGASLVQIYTGFIYQGPQLVGRLCRGLLAHLSQEGLPNVQALVGKDAAK